MELAFRGSIVDCFDAGFHSLLLLFLDPGSSLILGPRVLTLDSGSWSSFLRFLHFAELSPRLARFYMGQPIELSLSKDNLVLHDFVRGILGL